MIFASITLLPIAMTISGVPLHKLLARSRFRIIMMGNPTMSFVPCNGSPGKWLQPCRLQPMTSRGLVRAHELLIYLIQSVTRLVRMQTPINAFTSAEISDRLMCSVSAYREVHLHRTSSESCLNMPMSSKSRDLPDHVREGDVVSCKMVLHFTFP